MAPPRARRDPGAKRDDLVAAAARVVSREGVAATTTRRIAEEAGVPLGTVHYWFASKDELLQEVASAHVLAVQAAGRAAPDPVAGSAGEPAQDAAARLRAALDVEGSFDVGRRLSLYELTLWSLRSQERGEVAREQCAAVRAATRAVSEPWLAAHAGPDGPQVDPEVFAAFVAAFFDGLALAELADPQGTRAHEVLAVFADVVGAWVARPGS